MELFSQKSSTNARDADTGHQNQKSCPHKFLILFLKGAPLRTPATQPSAIEAARLN
jgi:uncharacterized protein YehS (DUF1456 family)